MSKIVAAAKEPAALCITGRAGVLSVDEQAALASWIALAAVIRDLQTTHKRRLNRKDALTLYETGRPNQNWYVGICGYGGPLPVGSQHSDYTFMNEEREVQQSTHSISSILGALFTTVCVIIPHKNAVWIPAQVYAHQLTKIWPPIFSPESVDWPVPNQPIVEGIFELGGGTAMSLARKVVEGFQRAYEATLARSVNESLRNDP